MENERFILLLRTCYLSDGSSLLTDENNNPLKI